MTAGIDCQLDRAVSHLLLHIDETCAILNQQRTECMPQVVKPDLADAGLRKDRQEVSVVEIIWVKNRAVRRGKNKFVQDFTFAMLERFK